MATKFTKLSYQAFGGILISLMCSCFAYGPIHEPYKEQGTFTPPPPPVAKKVSFRTKMSKHEYMQQTYTEMKNTLVEADVQMIEDSIKVLFPENIRFEKSSTYPSSNYQEPLAKFSTLLLKYSKTNILITGHTDNRGDKFKNKELSRLRAENIKSYIIQQGVYASRLESFGVGDLSPIALNDTDEGRSKNRRVEFVVLYRD